MKFLIELDEEYAKVIDKIKFLVGGRIDRKLQLEIIKAIKNGVPLEQEPCEDCISRDIAIANIQELAEWHTGDAFNADRVARCLKALPSVQPKIGHWKRVSDKTGKLVWECDCGWQQRFATNFCPDCGAKMVESQEAR